ncbi:MAG: FAD:protein FMN transferase [Pseudomonadales bacterium]
MQMRLSRRKMLSISGASLALAGSVFGLRALVGAPQPVRWYGEALGAFSSITLWHPDAKVASRAIQKMLVEVDRLDKVFSLYRADSEINALNRDGRLELASLDLVEVLEISHFVSELSAGAFDPSVQVLWRLLAQGGARRVDSQDYRKACALVDYTNVTVTGRTVEFSKTGTELGLNGIAQGYITDRITEILGNEGFESAVIELGELRALGSPPNGGAFRVGMVDPLSPREINTEVDLRSALAVSAGYGMDFGAPSDHHILDPHSGKSATGLLQVAVEADKAVWADALSTAIYVAGENGALSLLAGFPGARARIVRNDGTTAFID